jgi:hypothetical protein
MMSHDLASALLLLAKVLKAAPNVEISQLDFSKRKERITTTQGLALNLSTLAELSRIERQQWASLIEEYQLPIELRPRDASRDILGKLLRYLEENADAREKLKKSATRGPVQASPEVMRALSSLLDSNE